MECLCTKCLLLDECTPNKIEKCRQHCDDFEDATINEIIYTFINGEIYWEEMSYRRLEKEREYEPTEWELFLEEE